MPIFFTNQTRRGYSWAAAILAVILLSAGCGASRNQVRVKDIEMSFPPETILSGGRVVDEASMLADLCRAQIVYIGERHNDRKHHAWQLRILRLLQEAHPDLTVGMEMFDVTYQPVLNQWTNGLIEQPRFIEKVHWYANWRFPFDLYADILAFVRQQKIPLYGLNLPFHIPRKIAVGGIESLSTQEKRYIAADVDTSNAAHRDYVREIYDMHHLRGVDRFEYFYLAQCAWEDTMAENVVRHAGDRNMVVFAGNGHIVRKFGIPDRAHRRSGAEFRTVYLASVGSEVETDFADYIIVTESSVRHPGGSSGRMLKKDHRMTENDEK